MVVPHRLPVTQKDHFNCMDISVVMSTYNRSSVLGQALDALTAQDAGGLSYEVITVDNNSADSPRQVVESYSQRDRRIRYVLETKQGVAYGRNAGIAVARGEYIAFCDDDVVVRPDWLRNSHAALLRMFRSFFVPTIVANSWPMRSNRCIGNRQAGSPTKFLS